MVGDHNYLKRVILLSAFLLCAAFAAARGGSAQPAAPPPKVLPGQLGGTDSLATSARNERLYDTIASRYAQGRFSGLLYRSMFVRGAEEGEDAGKAVDESALYRPYEGRTISRIDIFRHDLIGRDSLWIERAANSLHTLTAEAVIRHDLLYKAGQRLDADLVTRNTRNLQSRTYLADAVTIVEPDPADTTQVIVTVITRDSWAVGMDGSISGNGRASLSIYDANFLGSGDRLGINNNFSWKNGHYGGFETYMDFPNFLGSYFNGHVEVGRQWENNTLGGELSRTFQRTTDYMAGASWYNRHTDTYMLYADSSMRVRSQVLDLWGGGALYIPRIKSSVYAAVRYTRSDFGNRPPVAPRVNPAFHDGNFVIGAAGLYRERFYTANLIYGYGYREYLPVGYRAEVLYSFYNGEFGKEKYAGASYRLGGFNRLGYLMGGVGLGSYFADGEWGRGTLLLESRYFTNLFRVTARTRARQFVSLNYLQGWNRYFGSDERVTFTSPQTLRGLDLYTMGVNRAHLGLETVFFTPYQPWGFRITMFAFTDMGLLGFDPNPFKNPFYSTVGFGIRVKNERLVFKAIEIRLGLAMGHGGLLKSEYFTLTSQNRIDPVSFTPEPPHIINYR
ncbi:MAG: hypothetical protein LBU95_04735 [Rikenellaceae bacterium]|jgi:hypothetical protein|nr:hypothetical protein [Rikenellaceae bacterium]